MEIQLRLPYYFTILNTHRYMNKDQDGIDFQWLADVLGTGTTLVGHLYFCDTFKDAVTKINEHSWYKRSNSYMIVKAWINPTDLDEEAKSEFERYQPGGEVIISNLTGRTKFRRTKEMVDQELLFYDNNIEEVTVRDRKQYPPNHNRLFKNIDFSEASDGSAAE